MSNRAATVKKYQYQGTVEVNVFHGESQRRLNGKLLPPIVLAFFWSTSERSILYFPQENIFVDWFSPSFVLRPWLCERCNFMLVSLSLRFADSYVYSNVIVCDYKQENVFAVPVLCLMDSGDHSGVFFLMLWGQGTDPAALTAVLYDFITWHWGSAESFLLGRLNFFCCFLHSITTLMLLPVLPPSCLFPPATSFWPYCPIVRTPQVLSFSVALTPMSDLPPVLFQLPNMSLMYVKWIRSHPFYKK